MEISCLGLQEMTITNMPMPNSPTSQVLVDPDSPSSPFYQPPVWPERDDYVLDTEELHSDGEDDPYFKNFTDSFLREATDVVQSTSLYDDMDWKASHQRQSDRYANIALKHYNNEEKNEQKAVWRIQRKSSSLQSGFQYSPRCDFFDARDVRVDAQHCYACGEALEHPKDGTLYEAGHFVSKYNYEY